MSIEVMVRVWATEELHDLRLLLMLAIADHCNSEGICWPSLATIAAKIRRSERQTSRLMQQMEADGFVMTIPRAGSSNLYQVALDKLADKPISVRKQRKEKHAISSCPEPGGDNYVSPLPKQGGDNYVSPPPMTTMCHGGGDNYVSWEPPVTPNRTITCASAKNALAAKTGFCGEEGVGGEEMEAPGKTRLTKEGFTSEVELGILLAGRKNGGDGDMALARAKWTLPSPELHALAATFIKASMIAPPKGKSARKDWIASMTEHMEEYSVEQLVKMYPIAIEQLRDDKMRVGRPGALTKTLPDLAREMDGRAGGRKL